MPVIFNIPVRYQGQTIPIYANSSEFRLQIPNDARYLDVQSLENQSGILEVRYYGKEGKTKKPIQTEKLENILFCNLMNQLECFLAKHYT